MVEAKSKLGKPKAISLVRDKCRDLYDKAKIFTYASKNSAVDTYWANPSPIVLKRDWMLILDDYIGQQLHVFFIEANAIDEDRIEPRPYNNRYGKRLQIDILYDDPSFTNRVKGYKFLPHHKATINYGEKATESEDASLTKE